MRSALDAAYNDFAMTNEISHRTHASKTLLLFTQSECGTNRKLFRLSQNSCSVLVNTPHCSLQALEDKVSSLKSLNTQVIVVAFGKERSGSDVVFETVASVRSLT